MNSDEFKRLALALRETGACKVRAGDLEVIWPGPFTPSPQAREAFTRGVSSIRPSDNEPPASTEEEARLRQYRKELNGED